ncbi:MAG: SEC-C domain-containing protein [Acidobacteria bacterium]|nr:SEC-C domain-containing protein [Acidobacteriota bacterium]
MPGKIGRNDPCPCGSGKKYKKCHGDTNYASQEKAQQRATPVMRNLLERNVLLLYAVAEVFGLKRGFRWKDVKRNISAEQVARFYRIIAELYPQNTDLLSLLPRGEKLRAFYVGDVDSQLTSHNIARMGLYVDELLVIVPFYNPYSKVPKLNPIQNPDLFKIDTYKLIYFLYLLGPALNSGLVKLVPNPGMFDDKLQLDFLAASYGRSKGKEISSETIEGLREEYANELHKVIRAESSEARESQLRQICSHMTDQEIALTLPYFEQLGKEETSIVVPEEVERKLVETAAQILAVRAGVSTDTALYLSQYTGAMPFTGSAWRWQELLTGSSELNNESFAPLTQAFGDLKFNFLNAVDRGFVGEFHSMNRLDSFRSYMRRIWQAADSDTNDESTLNALQSELTTEHQKAEGDWARIRQETKQWIAMVSDPDSSLEPVVDGKLHLSVPREGLMSSIGQEKFASLTDPVTKKVSMAAYIELAK